MDLPSFFYFPIPGNLKGQRSAFIGWNKVGAGEDFSFIIKWTVLGNLMKNSARKQGNGKIDRKINRVLFIPFDDDKNNYMSLCSSAFYQQNSQANRAG